MTEKLPPELGIILKHLNIIAEQLDTFLASMSRFWDWQNFPPVPGQAYQVWNLYESFFNLSIHLNWTQPNTILWEGEGSLWDKKQEAVASL